MAESSLNAEVRLFAQPAFEQIWTGVFAEPQSNQGRARSALFTAAGRKEGVSTLLAGAAITGASLPGGLRVALVDLNLRTPLLSRLLGVRNEPGLMDVLAGRASLDQVAQTIGSDNMTFYPGGAANTASSLWAGEGLRSLLGQLHQRHDFILCDCAAANLYPDAQVLAPLFDGAILVAEAGATRRESLGEAKKRIELGQGRVLGVILNKRRYPVPWFLYRRS